MSGEERNSFERELQKDSFAEEAAEGFSRISSEHAEKDISALQKRLDKRMSRRSPVIFYRIAAAVAVLMIVSGIFIVTQRKHNVITLSENINQEIKAPVSAKGPEILPPPSDKDSDKKKSITPSAPQKPKKDNKIADIKVAEHVTKQQVAEQEPALLKDSEVVKPDLFIAAGDEIASKSIVAEKGMDMARAAGAPANVKSEAYRDYVPPQPVIGRDSFDIYLEKNIRNPEPENTLQQVVVVSFLVHFNGSLDSIKIVRSPGKPFSDEAIRLIKAGPSWKPAEDNGKPIEHETRVRILFR